MTTSQVQRAADFIWLTGRVLDQRRMAYFRGEAGADGVLRALAAYATDCAYAFGLEPDIKGPAPQPLTVMTALRILDEVGAPCPPRTAEWLGSQAAPDGGIPALLPSIADYPRPPWIEAPQAPVGGLLPTARIVGLLVKHGITTPWLGAATEFCWRQLDEMTATHPYEVHSCVVFLDNAPDRDRAKRAAAKLGGLVRDQGLFLADPGHPENGRTAPGYADTEFHYAYDFAQRPDSVAVKWFAEEEIEKSLDHLERSQEDDGGWQISWRRWGPTTESEARPGVTVEKLHILRAWNRLTR